MLSRGAGAAPSSDYGLGPPKVAICRGIWRAEMDQQCAVTQDLSGKMRPDVAGLPIRKVVIFGAEFEATAIHGQA